MCEDAPESNNQLSLLELEPVGDGLKEYKSVTSVVLFVVCFFLFFCFNFLQCDTEWPNFLQNEHCTGFVGFPDTNALVVGLLKLLKSSFRTRVATESEVRDDPEFSRAMMSGLKSSDRPASIMTPTSSSSRPAFISSSCC